MGTHTRLCKDISCMIVLSVCLYAVHVSIDPAHRKMLPLPNTAPTREENTIPIVVDTHSIVAVTHSVVDTNAIRPTYSVILTVYNQEDIVEETIRRLLSHTAGPWELIVVVDGCTDRSEQVVRETLLRSSSSEAAVKTTPPDPCSLGQLVRTEIIALNESVYETSADNLGMKSAHSDAEFFILMQSDIMLYEDAWNVALTLPVKVRSDVFSVSGRCAHNLDGSHLIGVCTTDVEDGPKIVRGTFHVRQTCNRGPLLLNATTTRMMGLLDEEAFLQGNDDHDLNARANAMGGWVAAYYPVGFKAPLRYGASRRADVRSHATRERDEKYTAARRSAAKPPRGTSSAATPTEVTVSMDDRRKHLCFDAELFAPIPEWFGLESGVPPMSIASKISAAHKLYITYGHKCCEKSKKRACDAAVNTGMVDECRALDLSYVDADFQARHAKTMGSARGAGYWLWKPYIINRTLHDDAMMRDGDYLIYADAGSYLNIPVHRPLSVMEMKEPLLHGVLLPTLTHRQGTWCRRDAFIKQGCDTAACHDVMQVDGAFSFWRKGPHARAVANAWLADAADHQSISDEPSVLGPELPQFIDHRHDQAVLTNVMSREGWGRDMTFDMYTHMWPFTHDRWKQR